MKSTRRLVDNLMNDDFRKAKVDLSKAVNHVMKQRVEERKKQIIKSFNEK